jgi:hypothetical protein
MDSHRDHHIQRHATIPHYKAVERDDIRDKIEFWRSIGLKQNNYAVSIDFSHSKIPDHSDRTS